LAVGERLVWPVLLARGGVRLVATFTTLFSPIPGTGKCATAAPAEGDVSAGDKIPLMARTIE
jgi:hypothetical protein